MISTIFAIALVAAGITVALAPVVIGLFIQHLHDVARSARAATVTMRPAPVVPDQARAFERAA